MTKNEKSKNEETHRFVVVVDSDTNDLVYIAILLQRFEFQVCTTRSAAEALEMTAVIPPVLVVTSQEVVDMSGYDLVLRLRLDPRTSEVPVIVLTDVCDLIMAQRFREAGVAACLDKPVPVETLYAAVQAAVSKPRKNLRITTELPVTVNGVLLRSSAGECATVISEHGIYIRTLKPAAKGTRVVITILIKNKIVPVETVVLYTYGHLQGLFKEPGMGLEFVRINSEDRELIRQYIHEEITQGVAPSSIGRRTESGSGT
jgi:response regulator RpfG family c-di-GMP phosphodiesterase